MAASSAICPNPRIAISSTSTWVPSGAERMASGSPISVFQFCGLDATIRCGEISAVVRSLVEVFPTEPVIPITCAARSRRQARASAPSAAVGVWLSSTAPRSTSTASAAHSPVTSTPHAPAASAIEANEPPSTCSPGMPMKRSPGPTSRESMTTRDGPSAARPSGCGRSRSAPVAPAIRWSLQCFIARNASRATVTSSNGSLRPPANSCPCSWPLPAITTTSPGPASSTACSMASRRSTRTSASPGMPARISPMIASGSSERGLSEVTIATSASRAAISPISGRLPRSRSPPAPNTAITRRSASSRAARSAFSSESGVCE